MMGVIRRGKANRHFPMLHQRERSLRGLRGGPHCARDAKESKRRIFSRVRVRRLWCTGHVLILKRRRLTSALDSSCDTLRQVHHLGQRGPASAFAAISRIGKTNETLVSEVDRVMLGGAPCLHRRERHAHVGQESHAAGLLKKPIEPAALQPLALPHLPRSSDSRTSRTLRARVAGVKGFCRNSDSRNPPSAAATWWSV